MSDDGHRTRAALIALAEHLELRIAEVHCEECKGQGGNRGAPPIISVSKATKAELEARAAFTVCAICKGVGSVFTISAKEPTT